MSGTFGESSFSLLSLFVSFFLLHIAAFSVIFLPPSVFCCMLLTNKEAKSTNLWVFFGLNFSLYYSLGLVLLVRLLQLPINRHFAGIEAGVVVIGELRHSPWFEDTSF